LDSSPILRFEDYQAVLKRSANTRKTAADDASQSRAGWALRFQCNSQLEFDWWLTAARLRAWWNCGLKWMADSAEQRADGLIIAFPTRLDSLRPFSRGPAASFIAGWVLPYCIHCQIADCAFDSGEIAIEIVAGRDASANFTCIHCQPAAR
jgi:hypothetical protein